MSMSNPFKPVEWDESMSVGIEVIDKQHRFLVDTLQEANEKLMNDESGAMLQDIAVNLLRYAIMHFEAEEGLMQRYGYQDAYPEESREHIAQHRDFSRKVVAIRDQLREGQKVSRIDVLNFLNSWLYNHLLGIDQQYGEYLRKSMNESDS